MVNFHFQPSAPKDCFLWLNLVHVSRAGALKPEWLWESCCSWQGPLELFVHVASWEQSLPCTCVTGQPTQGWLVVWTTDLLTPLADHLPPDCSFSGTSAQEAASSGCREFE